MAYDPKKYNRAYNTDYYAVKDANSFRKSMGVAPLVAKERACLRCEDRFPSEGKHNRMCPRCRIYGAGGGRIDWKK